jgi:hypothetical protein
MKVDAVAGGIGDPSQPAHPGLDEGLRIFPPGLWHLAVAAGTSFTVRSTQGWLSQFHSGLGVERGPELGPLGAGFEPAELLVDRAGGDGGQA